MTVDGAVVRLIAAREVRERARARRFVVATAVLLVAAVAADVVPAFLDDDRPDLEVGVVGPPSVVVGAALRIAGSGEPVDVVELGSVAVGDEALREGDVDVVVDGTTAVLIRGERTGDRAQELAGRLASAIPVAMALESAGLPPERIGAVLSPAPLPVRPVDPTREDEGSRDSVFLGGLALYLALISYDGWVGMGVLEEKSSRVVEVVLSAVRPAELLAGKIIGIGLLGLAQLAVLGGVGLLAAVVAGVDPPPRPRRAPSAWCCCGSCSGSPSTAVPSPSQGRPPPGRRTPRRPRGLSTSCSSSPTSSRGSCRPRPTASWPGSRRSSRLSPR